MIQLKITGVSRRASSQVGTKRYTYKDGTRTSQQFHGAEWEEVEIQILEEDEPPIGIANIDGSAFLVGNGARILLNHPDLFGTFKVGDIINFVVAPTIETATATEPAPAPTPSPEVIETTAEPIVIPKLT